MKIRFESAPGKILANLQQLALTEALKEGNTALAVKVIKPEHLDALLASNITLENLPNIVKLMKAIPTGGLNTLVQIGKDYLAECRYAQLNSANQEKRQKLNQALLLLKEVLPNEVRAVEQQLEEQINRFTNLQIVTIHPLPKEEYQPVLESITLLFSFLAKEEVEVGDFIECLTAIRDKVDNGIAARKERDLLLGAFVGLGRQLLLRAGEHIRDKVYQQQVDVRDDDVQVALLQGLLENVPPLFATTIEFKVEMEVENDDLIGDLVAKFPDLNVDVITTFVHTQIQGNDLDVGLFDAWLKGRFPEFEVTTLDNLLLEYTLNLSFEAKFGNEGVSHWIYRNIIERGTDLATFQAWWEEHKEECGSLEVVIDRFNRN